MSMKEKERMRNCVLVITREVYKHTRFVCMCDMYCDMYVCVCVYMYISIAREREGAVLVWVGGWEILEIYSISKDPMDVGRPNIVFQKTN